MLIFAAFVTPVLAQLNAVPAEPTICTYEATKVIEQGGSVTTKEEANQPSENACRQFCNRWHELESGRGTVSFAGCLYNGQAISWSFEQSKEVTEGPTRWTCVVQYEKPVIFSGQETNEVCHDLQRPDFALKTEESANQYCNDFCEPYTEAGGSNPGRGCYFIRRETCQSYKETTSGKFESVKLEDELRRLRGEVGGLSQVGNISLGVLIGRVIRSVMAVMGSLALIIFIYGGLTWMMARGNADKTTKALHTLLWGGLGVAVILSSYAVISFVFQAFQ